MRTAWLSTVVINTITDTRHNGRLTFGFPPRGLAKSASSLCSRSQRRSPHSLAFVRDDTEILRCVALAPCGDITSPKSIILENFVFVTKFSIFILDNTYFSESVSLLLDTKSGKFQSQQGRKQHSMPCIGRTAASPPADTGTMSLRYVVVSFRIPLSDHRTAPHFLFYKPDN